MNKIQLIFPYPSFPISRQSKQWNPNWGNFIPAKWDDNIFQINNTNESDFLVVFDDLLEEIETDIPIKNRFLFTAEPETIKKYNNDFLNQFGHIITCQREIKHPNVTYFHQGHNWFVGKSYDELINDFELNKTKSISIIISNKQFTDGHKRRFDFVMSLKEKFGDSIDLFGRGIRDFQDKWEVLSPYRYSIAIENLVCEDWITEKIYDCYLANTFPIYYGCPNISKYFKPSSYELIDIDSIDNSYKKIDSILNDKNHFESKIKDIFEAKERYLNNYNIFPLIVNLIKQNKLMKETLLVRGTVAPMNHFNANQTRKSIVQKILGKFR